MGTFNKTTTRRVEACYDAGIDWLNWYESAHDSIATYVSTIDHNRPQPIRDMAAFLSIASPRVQVSRSIKIAKRFFETGEKLPGTMTSIFSKLQEFENSPNDYTWPLKTGKFFAAILGDTSAIVVDIHISRVYGFDDGFPMKTTIAGRLANDAICDNIRGLATKTGNHPRNVQAAIWCGWLRFSGKLVGELTL